MEAFQVESTRQASPLRARESSSWCPSERFTSSWKEIHEDEAHRHQPDKRHSLRSIGNVSCITPSDSSVPVSSAWALARRCEDLVVGSHPCPSMASIVKVHSLFGWINLDSSATMRCKSFFLSTRARGGEEMTVQGELEEGEKRDTASH